MASGNSIKQLDDLTECPICTEVYTDPRVLPCIHTYCLKCIETWSKDKHPGDEMACPLCRKEFTLPGDDGPAGLPKHFFIEKLLQIRELSLTESKSVPCDACSFAATDNEVTVNSATMFCPECQEKLCETCVESHRKLKATRSHELIAIGEQANSEGNYAKLKPPSCDKHLDKVLELYCFDCKLVVCMMCYIVNHKSHECSDVREVAEEFRGCLTSDVDKMAKGAEKCGELLKNLTKDKENFIDQISRTEVEVSEKAEQLKQLIESHKQQKCLVELASIQQSRVKKMEGLKDEMERQFLAIESLRKYASEITKKGTACDIARATSSLHERAEELLKFDVIERSLDDLGHVNVTFTPSNLVPDDASETMGNIFVSKNIANRRNVDHDVDDRSSSSADQHGIQNVGKNTSQDVTESKLRDLSGRLKEAVDQLRKEKEIGEARERELSDTKEQLKVEKERADVAEANLYDEKESRKSTELQLRKVQEQLSEVCKVRQELEKKLEETVEQRDGEKNRADAREKELDKVKQHLQKEKQELIEAKKQVEIESRAREDCVSKLKAVEDQLKKLVDAEEKTWKETQSKLEAVEVQLKKAVERIDGESKKVILNTPWLTHIIPKCNHVFAVTLLGDNLFVTLSNVKEVEVYNAVTLILQRRLPVPGLGPQPFGLAACATNNCLYTSDCKNNTIHRIGLANNIVTKWPVASGPMCLSLNNVYNVIVSCFGANKLGEYTTRGALVREICLQTGLACPWHAVQLPNGQFVVSHEQPVHNVSVVEANGRVVRSYTESEGAGVGVMKLPRSLAVNKSGCILVADRDNNRILALNPSLTSAQVLPLSVDGGLHCPYGLCMDESRGRLYVSEETEAGRILLFQQNIL